MNKQEIILKNLYLQNATSLICYACRFVDDYVAEDIVQEAFIKLYERYMAQIRIEEDMRKLLFRIVRNGCIDYLRHEASVVETAERVRIDLSLQEIATEDFYQDEYAEEMEVVLHAVERLPQRRREIFELYYKQGLKSDEIAGRLSLSKRTVENSIYRSLLTIRKECAALLSCFILILMRLF